MRQSARIVKQALEECPKAVASGCAARSAAGSREDENADGGPHLSLQNRDEGFLVPQGEVYQTVESPRGELGYYVVSDGTSRPFRVHMRTPSFGNLQGLPAMIEGRLLADTSPPWAVWISCWETWTGRPPPMTFSPELETRFEKLMHSYPPGRESSALIPMLLYAQDETGALTPKWSRRSPGGSGSRRSRPAKSSATTACCAASPRPASSPDLHQHQLHAARRAGTVRARLETPRIRNRESPRTESSLWKRRNAWAPVLGACNAGQLRLPSRHDAGEARPADRQPGEKALTRCCTTTQPARSEGSDQAIRPAGFAVAGHLPGDEGFQGFRRALEMKPRDHRRGDGVEPARARRRGLSGGDEVEFRARASPSPSTSWSTRRRRAAPAGPPAHRERSAPVDRGMLIAALAVGAAAGYIYIRGDIGA